MQIALSDNGSELKGTIADSIQLHIFMDLFFATFLGAAFTQKTEFENYSTIMFLVFVNVTFAVQICSMSLQIMYLVAMEVVPSEIFIVWLARRVSVLHIMLTLHTFAFYLFITSVMMWPYFYHSSTVIGLLCSCSQAFIYLIAMIKFGIADYCNQVLSPIVTRRACPSNTTNIAIEVNTLDGYIKKRNKENSGDSNYNNNNNDSENSSAFSRMKVNDPLENVTLSDFLQLIELQNYLNSFKQENIIDVNTLLELSDDDYGELGITIGHKVKIRHALKSLLEERNKCDKEEGKDMNVTRVKIKPTRRRRGMLGRGGSRSIKSFGSMGM